MQSGVILISSEIAPSTLQLEKLQQYLGHAPNTAEKEEFRQMFVGSIYIHEINHAVFSSIYNSNKALIDNAIKDLTDTNFRSLASYTGIAVPAGAIEEGLKVRILNESLAKLAELYYRDIRTTTEQSTYNAISARVSGKTNVVALQTEISRILVDEEPIAPGLFC